MVKNFLGNHRVENYKELVKKLLKSLQEIGANMSIGAHFLHSNLDKILDNCGDVRKIPLGYQNNGKALRTVGQINMADCC